LFLVPRTSRHVCNHLTSVVPEFPGSTELLDQYLAMNVFFKKAEEIGNKVFGGGGSGGGGGAQAQQEQAPVVSGVAEVEVSYEQSRYKLHLDVSATAAAFCTQIYLATGVIPARQKIVGFKVHCPSAI
jgi:hypothetical protein